VSLLDLSKLFEKLTFNCYLINLHTPTTEQIYGIIEELLTLSKCHESSLFRGSSAPQQ